MLMQRMREQVGTPAVQPLSHQGCLTSSEMCSLCSVFTSACHYVFRCYALTKRFLNVVPESCDRE